jgi:PAS domain S-box-containing protein
MIQWTETCRVVDVERKGGDAFFLKGAPEAILKTIIDSISDGIIIIDKSGCVLHMNRQGAAILDLDQNEVIGKHVTEIVDFRPIILDVLESEQGYLEKEFILHSPSRGRLHFIKSAIILRDRGGEMIGVIDTFRRVDTVHTMIARITGAKAKFSFGDIVGKAAVFQEAIDLSRIAAQSTANVLLEGESGTGKEMFAHAIHQGSTRNSGPFIIVNCASLPRSLIESELFGYESGSFTGARKEGFAGKFEQANRGTIFLDEIGEIPLDMQAKLLRVIQDRTFTRIGGNKIITVDTRIIAATNKGLLEEIRSNNFREDLYYRLNVLRIHIPSLRERPGDIPILAAHFARKNALHHGRPVPEIEPDVLRLFREYSWPGNVREFENVIERAMIINRNNRITRDDLPQLLTGKGPNAGAAETPDPKNGHCILDLESLEKEEIRRALYVCEGNVSHCSKLLGVSRNTLYRKMKRYAL